MKEDQTELITARLEHLRFLMESGKMPIFRHRSDMFLFALEAHNIARGLSSRYYRLQEDLDIRFFIRFNFDYWQKEIETWIRLLSGAEYRVDDDDFFAEGRAKRLTIVVDRLFRYHEDKLPADSAQGSMPLPKEEILEPFRAIMQMKYTDLVASFREALKEVQKYLQKLSMLPVDWPVESRCRALQIYLEDSLQKDHVQTELRNYRYFCGMPDGETVTGQFCYLRQRLVGLTANDEFGQLKCTKSVQQEQLIKLQRLFGQQEYNPSEEQLPANAKPIAGDELFASFLYFVCLDGECSFPVLDGDKVSNYLTRKDVFLSEEQEQNLQALFALMGAMRQHFSPILKKCNPDTDQDTGLQGRIDMVLKKVKHYNSCLSSLLAYKRTAEEVDAFFATLFSSEWHDDYATEQDELLKLFEKDRDAISLKTYIRTLRVAMDALGILKSNRAPGKQIYKCLKDEDFMKNISEDTVNTYYTKQAYRVDEDKWKDVIDWVDTIAKVFKS